MAQARSPSRLNRLRLPSLALAIPLVALAGLGTTVAVTHHNTPAPGPTPLAVATPTPAPTPTLFPNLFAQADDFTLLAPRSYGSISTPNVTLPQGLSIAITLAAQPGTFPMQLPVWHLEAPPLDARDIATRFGISADANPIIDHGITSFSAGLAIDAQHADIHWEPSGVPAPLLGGMPRDNSSAAALAMRWLQRSGLAPYPGANAAVEQTSSGDSASQPEWMLTWSRTAPGNPDLTLDQTTARVSGNGTLRELDLSRPRVSRGSLYPLRPWQDALRDAQNGRWFQMCCGRLPDFTTSGIVHLTVHTVSLVYALVDVAGAVLDVPMYAFSETPGETPGLVPAIAG